MKKKMLDFKDVNVELIIREKIVNKNIVGSLKEIAFAISFVYDGGVYGNRI